MQKKVEFIAKTMEEAQAIAVEKLHISSEKIFSGIDKFFLGW